jgi:hypothetical protein
VRWWCESEDDVAALIAATLTDDGATQRQISAVLAERAGASGQATCWEVREIDEHRT